SKGTKIVRILRFARFVDVDDGVLQLLVRVDDAENLLEAERLENERRPARRSAVDALVLDHERQRRGRIRNPVRLGVDAMRREPGARELIEPSLDLLASG